jgi:hypothetical protein
MVEFAFGLGVDEESLSQAKKVFEAAMRAK